MAGSLRIETRGSCSSIRTAIGRYEEFSAGELEDFEPRDLSKEHVRIGLLRILRAVAAHPGATIQGLSYRKHKKTRRRRPNHSLSGSLRKNKEFGHSASRIGSEHIAERPWPAPNGSWRSRI